MTSNQSSPRTKACWGREQLQPEMLKGELQEDQVNCRHPDPARRAGWQRPGRHVTHREGTGSQEEAGRVYTPSRRGAPNPPEIPRVSTWPAAPSDDGQLRFRGETRTSSRCWHALGPEPRRSPPASSTHPSCPPSSRARQASRAAAASAIPRGCGSGRAGRGRVPLPASLPPRPNLLSGAASFQVRRGSPPRVPGQERCRESTCALVPGLFRLSTAVPSAMTIVPESGRLEWIPGCRGRLPARGRGRGEAGERGGARRGGAALRVRTSGRGGSWRISRSPRGAGREAGEESQKGPAGGGRDTEKGTADDSHGATRRQRETWPWGRGVASGEPAGTVGPYESEQGRRNLSLHLPGRTVVALKRQGLHNGDCFSNPLHKQIPGEAEFCPRIRLVRVQKQARSPGKFLRPPRETDPISKKTRA